MAKIIIRKSYPIEHGDLSIMAFIKAEKVICVACGCFSWLRTSLPVEEINNGQFNRNL